MRLPGRRSSHTAATLIAAALLAFPTACSTAEPQPTVLAPTPSAEAASAQTSPTSESEPSESSAEPASSAPATSAATSASSEPEPEAPLQPPGARELSREGASEFVGYYFSLVDYAFRTGDTSELTAISSEECAPCQQSIEVVESTYGQGHEYIGGEITLHGAESPTLDPVDAAEVFANYSAADIEELAPDGAVVNTISGVDNLRLRFVVTWNADGEWQVRDLHEVDG